MTSFRRVRWVVRTRPAHHRIPTVRAQINGEKIGGPRVGPRVRRCTPTCTPHAQEASTRYYLSQVTALSARKDRPVYFAGGVHLRASRDRCNRGDDEFSVRDNDPVHTRQSHSKRVGCATVEVRVPAAIWYRGKQEQEKVNTEEE